MAGPDWLEAGKAFAELGFFGVTAFLLWERFTLTRDRGKRDSELADAMLQQAVSNDRLVKSLEQVNETLRWLHDEIRLALHAPQHKPHRRRGNGG